MENKTPMVPIPWDGARAEFSLRDWFAGQSLAGLRSRDLEGAGERGRGMNMHHNHADVCAMANASSRLARIAYEDADAMLKARDEK